MRVPLSWLRDYVAVPDHVSPRAVADALIKIGLEVETVEHIEVEGPLVVGRVLEFTEETHRNGKSVRWCQVDVGGSGTEPSSPQGIVCGASNFDVGDLVVVALPGCVLPGGFAITARRTYGHTSAGMICSLSELGLGDDHDGILVLHPADVPGGELPAPGEDARDVLGLPEAVLDIAVTPDRGYCFSVRGVAREVAAAFGQEFVDPGDREAPRAAAAPGEAAAVRVDDTDGCSRFVARRVTGVDPAAPSPLWLRTRLYLAGMRPLSVAVDITNHVMLDLGQPIHGYDGDSLRGAIVVRRAALGEHLVTLDGQQRELSDNDLLICDDSGPIGIAGVMGGTTTELGPATSEVVVEAAHFDPVAIARTSRRHKLSSEASRRFERGVDPRLPHVAADAVVRMLVDLAGGTADPGVTEVGNVTAPAPVEMAAAFPGRLTGVDIDPATVLAHLRTVGCEVEASDGDELSELLVVRPPTWRPDLRADVDLAEEVIRLHGYDAIPSRVPVGPATHRPNREVRRAVRIGRALAYAGCVEVRNYPFVSREVMEDMGVAEDAAYNRLVRLANPISEQEPYLRTSLLPGLFGALRRNIGRGFTDVALFEHGRVFIGPEQGRVNAPRLPVDRAPTAVELQDLDAGLPAQPFRVAAVLTGKAERSGWWGAGRPVTWADAVAIARRAAVAVDAPVEVRAGGAMPFHPGRCGEIVVAGERIGWAGEIHPRVLANLGLPPRTCAMELDQEAVAVFEEGMTSGPRLSTFPMASIDVALVVPEDVPSADVGRTLLESGGSLLEHVELFDVYSGEQLAPGTKSLAFTLRLRAPDRTLDDTDIAGVRDAVIAATGDAFGAELRG
jgi:phenylalanyl-tRNA synthetase beta chain